MIRRFLDRTDAGQELARAMRHYRGQDNLVVLGLPRGGVPVAYEVARELAAPLDICVVRKLGVPGQEELAMGAIESGDVFVLNHEVVKALRVSDELIEEAVAVEKRELQRRELAYRGDQPAVEVSGSAVVLVDDGLATGATMRAAIGAMRQRGASPVIVAVPVAPITA